MGKSLCVLGKKAHWMKASKYAMELSLFHAGRMVFFMYWVFSEVQVCMDVSFLVTEIGLSNPL